MSIDIGDLLTIGSEKYITIEVLCYDNKNYAFVNKSLNGDVTDDFYILEIFEDKSVRIVYEDEIKNELISRFEEKLREDIKKIAAE